jgi:two-component system invasion response regulator UvrY
MPISTIAGNSRVLDSLRMLEAAIRVLVVDDHPDNLALVGEVVDATAGFAIVGQVASGEEALSELERRPADVVLMDVQMPGVGGVMAARAASRLHDRPLVFLISSDDQPTIAADPSAHGAVAFVRKEKLSPGLLRRLWAMYAGAAAIPPTPR